MDLNNINITANMFFELSQILNNNEDYVKKYIISNKNDLFDEKRINFYYILFKYMLKCQLYIYHIPFLLESRKNILKIIKYNLKEIQIKDIKDNYNKFEYIIDFFTDSKYYLKYLESIISNEEQNAANKSIKNNSLNVSSQISKRNDSTYPKTISSDTEDDYIIIKFEKIIKEFDKKNNHVNFIKELSNGDFIIGAPNDNLYIYDENFRFIKNIFRNSK